ncbi:HTH-type transcriptional activator RhaS [bioreactor metagenome]|uniref:HTH-type transcriptional activator RhaS n=1 Tax=bioreactor metagenome TaxID=1076179 RepID=A0A644ZBM0_9ZZZZ
MPEGLEGDKRGYLLEDFRLFRLKDTSTKTLEYHYHEFDKLILLLGGKVTYMVEGVTYFLQPWDLLLVPRNQIHRALIDTGEPYERMVLWLGREWMDRRSDPDEPLSACFDLACRRGFHLLRTDGERRPFYLRRFQELEEALRSREYGSGRMADACCQQLLIDVNRDSLRDKTAEREKDAYRSDPKIEEILHYIAGNLDGPLTVDALAERFFLSRYYLMHRFKEVTGYTVHQYISQKRLLLAGELLREGTPVMRAAVLAGFGDYSAFLRAFRATFHASPRDFQPRR